MSEDDLILTHILGCRHSDLLINKPRLSPGQQKHFDELKTRRLRGEPLQYILGSWEFYGLEFRVDSRVLVPRPETEILAGLAIQKFIGSDILDLGTGSGNITVTLAKMLPYARVTSVDISVDALGLAMENAQSHGVASRVEFVYDDMGVYLAACGRAFDLIVSNPPYVPSGQIPNLPADVRQEPLIALDGGADGLDFYRTIIKSSPRLLRGGGYLMMEFGDGQAESVQSLVKAEPAFSSIEIHKDLAGRERVIVCHSRAIPLKPGTSKAAGI